MSDGRRSSRAAWIVGWSIAVVGGLIALVVFWPRSSDTVRSNATVRATVVRPGSVGSSSALWAFSERTYRIEGPQLERVGALDQQGYGEVAGTPGAVFFFEPGQGRFGVLDAARNRITELPGVGAGDPNTPPNAIAVSDRYVWLRVAPNRVRAYDRNASAFEDPVGLPLAPAEPVRLVSTSDGVLAIGRDGSGALATVELPDARPYSAVRPLARTGALGLVAGGGRRAWIESGRELLMVDVASGALERAVAFDRDARALGAGATGAYVLTADAALARVDPSGVVTDVRSDLAPPTGRPLRLPAQVVVTDAFVYVLVCDDPEPNGRAVSIERVPVAGGDPVRDRFPSSAFIGAIAVT